MIVSGVGFGVWELLLVSISHFFNRIKAKNDCLKLIVLFIC